ncbi:MAG: endolytic transglycosylase MltG [Caldisericia bacterium]|nr:endolytic transglycosylase MltG [Caldisericia bacterium]
MKTGKYIIATLILFLVIAGAGISLWITENQTTNPTMPFVFEIQEEETVESISNRLQEAGVIKNARFFRYYLRYTKKDKTIQAGYYLIPETKDLDELVKVFQEGKAKMVKYTIPEGYTIRRIAKKLAEEGLVDEATFIDLASKRGTQFTFPYLDQIKDGNLEGFLFPETYFIANPTEETIIQQMLDQFSLVMEQSILPKWSHQKWTLREIIILSSIVEREAQADQERPIIASVFLNRIQAGWKLEACSTVEYVIQKEGYVLTLDELQVDSPYNTYKYIGLPAGPICNPGLDSILATLAPAKTDYFFFAAKGDGSHAFAATLEEHNRNVAKYIP